jgi:arylsulfatase A-like enzyme
VSERIRGSRRRLSAGATVLLVAAATALATGAVQDAIVAVQLWGLHRIVFTGRDFIWMAPLSYLVLFAAIGLLPSIAAVAWPRLGAAWLWMGVYAGIGVFSLFLPFGQISHYASLILAAGVGVQVARTARQNAPRWRRRYARGAVALAGVIALTGGGLRLTRALDGARARAALPDADAGAPNVLLIIWDTVRAQNLSVYGYDRATTPGVEAWGGEGAVFEQAVAPAPWTLPSHATMFTGRYPDELGANWYAPLERTPPTLAEVLARRGYATAGFAANSHYTSYDSGLERGFGHYEAFRVSFGQTMRSSWLGQLLVVERILLRDPPRAVLAALWPPQLQVGPKMNFDRKPAAEVTSSFLRWERERGTRPFFAFLNYFDAHLPVAPHPPFTDRLRGSGARADLLLYDGALAMMDAEVTRILDALRQEGTLDNTIVVLTSDHGEMYGEHGLYGHANNMYREVLHVPLAMRYPRRVPAGVRVGAPVTLRDLPATILDLAGVSGAPLPGRSLAAWWGPAPAGVASPVLAEVKAAYNVPENYPTRFGPMKALFTDSLHYILRGDGEEELFAYRTDPGEAHDLARQDSASLVASRARLRQALADARSNGRLVMTPVARRNP